MRKLNLLFLGLGLIALSSIIGCKKTTNNTTVVQDSVFYSSWTTLSMSYDGNDSIYFQDFQNSRITSDFVSSGAVFAYLGVANQGDTVIYPANENGMYSVLGAGTLETQSYQDYSGNLYRYVLVPGTVLANTSFKGLTQSQLSKVTLTDLQKELKAATATTTAAKP